MEKETWIDINPRIMMGKPVIRGTRITVELILERMSLGQTINDLIIAYPSLNEEKIHSALSFAAHALKGDTIIATEI
jgi:uncharacterized protein (DUF433 family)